MRGGQEEERPAQLVGHAPARLPRLAGKPAGAWLLPRRMLLPHMCSCPFPPVACSDAHAYFEGGHGAGKVLIKVAPLH